jgi:DNA-binding NtrC family response regulator
MTIRAQLQEIVSKMLDGRILLPEALEEFEKLFIERALSMNDNHLMKTATALGIHRNTLTKKISSGSRGAKLKLKKTKAAAGHSRKRKSPSKKTPKVI